MNDCARHLLHHPGRRWPLPGQIDDPCDAAHPATMAEDGVEKSQEMMRPEQSSCLAPLPKKKLGKNASARLQMDRCVPW
jgi:hypothetical protein